MTAFPDLHVAALEVGSHPTSLGIGRVSFASAIMAGGLITLMTWMERATESVPAKIASAWAIAFLLAGLPLQHAIVISIESFAALQVGAHFGYLDWLGTFGWAALGNMLGGLVLVTALRLLQVGPKEVREEQRRPKNAPRGADA